MNTTLRRTLLITAAILPMSAGFASAQYRIDNGSARDANNRIGSGGYNDGRVDGVTSSRIEGNGNYLVTGNVTGGRAFRGQVPYTDPTAFRGNLGSANFDPFIRDSTGIGQIRGNYGANAFNAQPFFGNQTVAPPPGFVRSQIDNGTFVQPGAAQILPNDTRLDYGGASRADVAQSAISNRQQFGNAGFAPTTGMQWTGPDADQRSPLQLSEYTSLARQRRDVFAGTDPTMRVSEPGDTVQDRSAFGRGGSTDPTDEATTIAPDIRSNASTPIGSPADPATLGDPQAAGMTGQSLSRRSSRAVDNNSQYAQLRERLAQVRGGQRGEDGQPRDPREALGGQPLGQQIGAGGAVSTGQGRQPGTVNRPSTPGAAPTEGTSPADNDAAAGAPGTEATPGDAAAGNGAAANTPGGTRSAPGVDRPAPAVGVPDNAPEDNLNLPRPEGEATTVTPRPATPVQINSFATGVKDPQLAKMLTEAETLMKAGKFGSAIDTYERAEAIASDDPLVFMGRSIAELGGGYYRNAEIHLRQAFAADASLLYAKFDLRSMIGDDRLNTLTANLSDIAGKNAQDPGPLLLLGFIYYNGGMEDRAARALDMAQVRAGGKDREIDALRKNWSLGASPAGEQTPAAEENK